MDIQIQNTVGEYFVVDISKNLTVADFCGFYAREMELEDVDKWRVKLILGKEEEEDLAAEDVIYDKIKNPLIDYLIIGPASDWEM